MIDIRDNARILMLVVLCIVAALALFGPLGSAAGSADAATGQNASDPTNLRYGLDLSGGTRIRGKLVGMTAEKVSGLNADNANSVEQTVAEELGLEPIDVQARVTQENREVTRTVEIYTWNVSKQRFADALSAAGLSVEPSQIRNGTTAATRERAVDTLTSRVDQTGLSGANVRTVRQAGGGHFIVVEVPGASKSRVEELIGRPGRVQIVAGFPRQTENGTELAMEPILSQGDFDGIQSATRNARSGPHVPVTLTKEAGKRFEKKMQEFGFTGGQSCSYDPEKGPSKNEYCLYTVVDGNITDGVGLSPDLADDMQSGTFSNDPSFIIQQPSLEQAKQVENDLRSGALPTEFETVTTSFLSPSTAQKFKPLALLTGLLAWLTVSLVVYLWYRDIRVAIPMLLTAGSEVFLLLGFAAGFGMALNLSHIAGLIAVIGTGLDDLIIMADEILQQDEVVNTGRVFQSRFRKAFWVIGMAAATTIIAMGPLAVLSLGELRGFAIITIVGVLIGVGVSRPAYGDILRQLVLDDVQRS